MIGRIFDIHRFSLDDGPGIRTSVFFKGCNLSCAWCHNPESISFEPQISKAASLCVMCGACRDACPRDAVGDRETGYAIARPGSHEATAAPIASAAPPLRGFCDACGACVDACPRGALKRVGYDIEARDLVDIILRDADFYEESGGGVTFTGGEPTAQADFLLEALALCKENGIHTALDTNGRCDEKLLARLSPLVDYVMLDIKHVDDSKHKTFTGSGCAAPMRAARFFAARSAAAPAPIAVEARVPVIPGFNYSATELGAIIDFLESARITRATFLPYHSYGAGKYKSLGLPYRLEHLISGDSPPSAQAAQTAQTAIPPLPACELQSLVDKLNPRSLQLKVAEN